MNNKTQFEFQLERRHTTNNGRAGTITTPHGQIKTPVFMPVGTLATVKSLDTQDIQQANAQIILGNTYHLYLRPGMEILEQMGGMHGFMGWDMPILTDSGGFQVFSLGAQLKQNESVPKEHRKLAPAKITDTEVTFTSHLDGTKHSFAPEKAIEIQRSIGADIIMAFDECLPDNSPLQQSAESVERTHRWAQQCITRWEEQERQSVYGNYQALFGIIQGGLHQELREHSARTITSMPFDGIAVGGETIGYNMAGTKQVMSWIEQLLPQDKPRYAMGLGRDPQDLVDAVQAGFDMFDCVGPTRLARNGALYVGELGSQAGKLLFRSDFAKGRLNIGNAKYKTDASVIQPGCDCATCRAGYSRSYLHHLYKTAELSYYRLASIHNVRFMVRLSEQLRAEVLRG